ncbi:MAG: orotidine-5'-phosphate decarboxylase [Desulfurococcales archaeon]|nr:orotidine-5'-phosphate decarboxylase [Desulfurococcales archaeon]
MVALPVIIGLDALQSRYQVVSLVQETCGLAAGYKVGLPSLLRIPGIGREVRKACDEALVIADLKLADIADTMVRVAEITSGWADAVIAHAFPGYEGALDGLSRFLEENRQKLVVVVAMSNPGASETMDPILEKLVGIAKRARAWGLVAPATRPHVIARARNLFTEAVILSPGVGAQGARPGEAVRAGADYEIIGRLITTSRDPAATLQSLAPSYKGRHV